MNQLYLLYDLCKVKGMLNGVAAQGQGKKYMNKYGLQKENNKCEDDCSSSEKKTVSLH